MTEGTKSYLVGCHQFFLHPLWVLMAWHLEYESWPKWWEIICIFLHDIGICGRQYLSDDMAKKGHWEVGAARARFMIWRLSKNTFKGLRAFDLCAGHCPEESRYPESKLSRADKRSWLVAPMWWLWWGYWVEGFEGTPPPEWKRMVAENLKREKPLGNHELYLRGRKTCSTPTSSARFT